MSFRLALVGHGSSIREIQEIVAETFENIETVGIEMPSDERVDEAAQALRRCLPELDGVLYTRSEPYKLMGEPAWIMGRCWRGMSTSTQPASSTRF